MNPLLLAILTAIAVPLVLVGYLAITERVIRRAGRARRTLRAAFWLAPAATGLGVMLVVPVLETVRLSFFDARGSQFVGLDNYVDLATDPASLIALRNNLLWLVFFAGVVTVLGTLIAALSDRVRYEKIVHALIVLPTAISFVGAGVIWGFIYDYAPPGIPPTGTLNAIVIATGSDPVPWLSHPSFANGSLIFIGIWMATGLATVILGAAIKAVPAETVESARLDGAGEVQVFLRIVLPQIGTALSVVVTLMVINSLKVFDIVYVLTNGNYDTGVLATRLYSELFSARNIGAASAIAVVILVVSLPVIVRGIRSRRAT